MIIVITVTVIIHIKKYDCHKLKNFESTWQWIEIIDNIMPNNRLTSQLSKCLNSNAFSYNLQDINMVTNFLTI